MATQHYSTSSHHRTDPNISQKTKASALYCDICNVGKSVQASKKRVTWRVKVANGDEHEISLTHSLGSGKKVLRVDGVQVHKSQSLGLLEWEYIYHAKGGSTLHTMIKPCPDLNDMYDLCIDGVSFRRLPKVGGGNSSSYSPSPYMTQQYHHQSPASPQQHNASPRYSNTSATTKQLSPPNYPPGPWTCTRCTLINEKEHANVCEACQGPRPLASASSTKKKKKKSVDQTPKPAAAETPVTFDPFGTASCTNEPSSSPAFDPFNNSGNAPPAANSSEFNPFEQQQQQQPVAAAYSTDNIFINPAATPASPPAAGGGDALSLSSIDFSTASPTPAVAVVNSPVASPPPAELQQPVSNSGDLWSSDMVQLNLSPSTNATAKAAPTGPTLMEQAAASQGFQSNPYQPDTPRPPVSGGMMAPNGSQNMYGTTPVLSSPPQRLMMMPPPPLQQQQMQGMMYATQQQCYSPGGQQQQRPQPSSQAPAQPLSPMQMYGTAPAQSSTVNLNDPFAGLS